MFYKYIFRNITYIYLYLKKIIKVFIETQTIIFSGFIPSGEQPMKTIHIIIKGIPIRLPKKISTKSQYHKCNTIFYGFIRSGERSKKTIHIIIKRIAIRIPKKIEIKSQYHKSNTYETFISFLEFSFLQRFRQKLDSFLQASDQKHYPHYHQKNSYKVTEENLNKVPISQI